MANTRLMCGVLLDTKGPEIRTGMLKGGKPVLMEAGSRVEG
jgi:pyruvate kinase